MLGGVTVNVILAIVIFIMIMWVWGEKYLPPQNVKYGIVADSLGKRLGLKDGDLILKVGDKEVRNALRVPGEVILGESKIHYSKKGWVKILTVAIPDRFTKALNKTKGDNFVRYPGSFFADQNS